ISDRLAVMSHGKVLQVGTPEDIYARPEHPFVARFVGEGTFLPARVLPGGDEAEVIGGPIVPVRPGSTPGAARLGLRPEDLRLVSEGESAHFEGVIVARSYLGPQVQLRVDIGVDETLLLRVPSVECPSTAVPGTRVRVAMTGAPIAFAEDDDAATGLEEAVVS